MTRNLWLNYFILSALVIFLVWLFMNGEGYHDPFINTFFILLAIGLFFYVPYDTKLRRLLKKDRLKGLQQRVAHKKYEYIVITFIILFCVILNVYYSFANINSPALHGLTFSSLGAAFGMFIRQARDKQEIERLQQQK